MRRLIVLCVLLLTTVRATGQDGLNLPTELYILLNEGQVERYGLGSSGVERVTPEGEFVLDFRVAPDGNWLAYRTEAGLYLQNMYGDAPPLQIEGERASIPGLRGRGDTMAWTASSDALAYTTLYGGRVHFRDGGFTDLTTPGLVHLSWSPDGRYLATEAEGDIWWVFRREDSGEMPLVSAIPQAAGTAWLSSTQLLFAPPEGGLTVMNLAENNAQSMILDPSTRYRLPFVRPDGTVLLYALNDETPDRGRLLRVNLTQTGPIITEIGTAEVELAGVRWGPDGSLLVAFQGGVLALVDPQTGQGFTLPITSASAYSWGPLYLPVAPALQLAGPYTGFALAPDESGTAQVWRIPTDGALPLPVTQAAERITEYAAAPDRTRIVYRSGGALWLADARPTAPSAPEATPETTPEAEATASPDGPDPDDRAGGAVRLVTLTGSGLAWPVFSPDGSRIYYRDTDDAEGSGIWQIDLSDPSSASRTRQPLLLDSADTRYVRPRPAPNVAALLVTGEAADPAVETDDELLLVDINTGDAQPLGPYPDARWLQGTTALFAGQANSGGLEANGLYRIDVNSPDAPPQMVFPLVGPVEILSYAPRGNDVRLLIRRRVPGRVQVVDVPLAGGEPVNRGSAGYMVGARLAPDGSFVAGTIHPGGALVIHSVDSGETTRLRDPAQVQQHIWR